MLDIIFVIAVVLGAAIYLGFRLRKKIREIRNPKAAPGCSCGCSCSRKNPKSRE